MGSGKRYIAGVPTVRVDWCAADRHRTLGEIAVQASYSASHLAVSNMHSPASSWLAAQAGKKERSYSERAAHIGKPLSHNEYALPQCALSYSLS
jgi:hypothetical protein